MWSNGKVRKLVPTFFDREKYVLQFENLRLELYSRLGLKLKQIHCLLEFNKLQWLKPYIKFKAQKGIESEENGSKDVQAL